MESPGIPDSLPLQCPILKRPADNSKHKQRNPSMSLGTKLRHPSWESVTLSPRCPIRAAPSCQTRGKRLNGTFPYSFAQPLDAKSGCAAKGGGAQRSRVPDLRQDEARREHPPRTRPSYWLSHQVCRSGSDFICILLRPGTWECVIQKMGKEGFPSWRTAIVTT